MNDTATKTVGVITCWYRVIDGEINFNHITDGYDSSQEAPHPVSENQAKAWRGAIWEKREGRLVNGVVIEHALGPEPTDPVRWS